MKKMQIVLHNSLFKRIALVLLGACCYMYSIFAGDFAEWHISIPGLNFPIFIGEMLLAACLLLLVFDHFRNKPHYDKRFLIIGGLYVGYVLVKALTGYVSMGPLALRNAALFYYPFFVYVGFRVFEKDFWNTREGWWIFGFFSFCLMMGKINDFFIITYSLIVLGFALQSRYLWLRWGGVILVALHAYLSKFIFSSSRAHLIGLAAATVFLVWYYVFGLARLGKKFKVGLTIFLAVAFVFVLFKFGDRNAVRSLMTLDLVQEQFRELRREVDLKRKLYISTELSTELYNQNPNNSLSDMIAKKRGLIPDEEPPPAIVDRKIIGAVVESSKEYVEKTTEVKVDLVQGQTDAIYATSMAALDRNAEMVLNDAKRKLTSEVERIHRTTTGDIETSLQDALQNVVARLQLDHKRSVAELKRMVDQVADVAVKKMIKDVEERRIKVVDKVLAAKPDRSLQVAYNNMYFRLFIWRDMMEELWTKKAVFGVNWGEPQRSASIEVLEWASVEWRRDGWITPHNSFLHMIFRGGLVGLALVIGLFWLFGHLTRKFLAQRSVWGGLLIASLVYWATITNFLVFLEFPYNAIPFWTLLGMTWAYAVSLEKQTPAPAPKRSSKKK